MKKHSAYLNSWTALLTVAFLCQGCNTSWDSTPSNPPVTASPNTPQGDSPQSTCPANYVVVPGSPDFNTSTFCVAKYEAKKVNGLPESQPDGVPWGNVTRDQAVTACAAKGAGYALLDNSHWMTIARNIESVTWNFGGDAAQSEYGPSRGVTNNGGTAPLPASADDNNACYLATQSTNGTAAVCDLNTYDVARRVHKLSNDSLVWDFAGNASEWISDDMATNFGTRSWVLNLTDTGIKASFGPSGIYAAGPTNPPGWIYMYNLGYFSGNAAPPYVIFRGGGFSYGRYAGIYTTYFVPTTQASADIGFRCYFQLSQ